MLFFKKKRVDFVEVNELVNVIQKVLVPQTNKKNAQNHCPFEVTKIISINPNYSSTFVFTSGKQ